MFRMQDPPLRVRFSLGFPAALSVHPPASLGQPPQRMTTDVVSRCQRAARGE